MGVIIFRSPICSNYPVSWGTYDVSFVEPMDYSSIDNCFSAICPPCLQPAQMIRVILLIPPGSQKYATHLPVLN